MTLSEAEVAEVSAAVARYEAARAELEAAALAGVAALRARRAAQDQQRVNDDDRARGHFPTEAAALKCLYVVTRSLGPTGVGRQ